MKRRNVRRRVFLSAVVAGAAVLPAGFDQALAAAELFVDDDMAQCPNAGFTSIQAAVNAANAGDTIRVCPGTYNEIVTVNKQNLTLQGTGGPKSCGESAEPDPTKDSIVQAPPGGNAAGIILLMQNGIKLERFTIQNNTGPNAGPGINTSNLFSGYKIGFNLVQNNTFGLFFNSASGGSQSEVYLNCFRRNNVVGAANGNGIYSDAGLDKAVIRNNSFFRNENSAILLTGVPPAFRASNVSVRNNISVRDNAMLLLFFSRNIEAIGNVARNNDSSAIFLGPDNDVVRIAANDIKESFNGVRANAQSLAPPPGIPNTNVNIANNEIDHAVNDGISAAPSSLTGATISNNRAKNNGRWGIGIENGTVPINGQNVISGNALEGNKKFDCFDATTGSGTAGTANTWKLNKGKTASPPGICIKG